MKKVAIAILIATAAAGPVHAAPPKSTPAYTINGACQGPVWHKFYFGWNFWTPCWTGGISWS